MIQTGGRNTGPRKIGDNYKNKAWSLPTEKDARIARGYVASDTRRRKYKLQPFKRTYNRDFAVSVLNPGEYASKTVIKPKDIQLINPNYNMVTNKQTKSVPQSMEKVIKETTTKIHSDFDEGARHATNIHARKTIPVPGSGGSKTTYEMVDPFITPGVVESSSNIPQRVENSPRRMLNSTDPAHPRGTHRTRVDTGHPTSKVLQRLAKQNGTNTVLISDTKLSQFGNLLGHVIPRGELDHGHGFNVKSLFFLHGISSPGYRSIMEALFSSPSVNTLAGWLSNPTSSKFVDKRYMSFKWLESKISIHNENTYFPCKVKIYLIKPKYTLQKQNNDPSNTSTAIQNYLLDIQAKAFNLATGVQSRLAMPNFYQNNFPLLVGQTVNPIDFSETDNYKRLGMKVDLQLRGSITQSAWFRENFSIEKTFSKMLQPSDDWIFTHRQHFGPGIDIDAFRSHFIDMNFTIPSAGGIGSVVNNWGNDCPMGYIFAVETMGIPCTAVLGDATDGSGATVVKSTYQGTCPGQIHLEYRSKCSYIQATKADAGVSIGGDGSDQFVHVRTFTKQDYKYQDNRQVRYVPLADIVNTEAEVTYNKAFIPVVTDKSISGVQVKGLKAAQT